MITTMLSPGSRAVPGNYQPVGLTCVLCKVLESIIRDGLVGYLEGAGLSMGLGRVVRAQYSVLSSRGFRNYK